MVRTAQNRGHGGTSAPEVLKLTRRMTTLFRERLEVQLRPLGVTAAQLQLLAALAKEPGTSGAHISRFCQVTPQTTHALLGVATDRGWVRRSPHPENARMLLATLTPQGQRVFTRGKMLALRLQSRMLRTLTAGEVAHLEAKLSQLIKNLE
jgi:MarR family transcriptional regulator, organic hydroperoxide resistance regulator